MTNATSIRRLTPELEQIRLDALSYCDQRRIDDPAVLESIMGAMAHQAFLRNIEPYTKALADVMACGTGAVLQHADGVVEYIPQPIPTDLQKTFDELIEGERRRYGLTG